ncbi:hypothetical protein I6I68_03390 [Corynebacterium glucuronolyticum]|nr:hypothetical protein I6I68_03390 [Corynebacterium glucuronolyticum]
MFSFGKRENIGRTWEGIVHYQGVPFYEQAENSWEKKRRMEKLRRDLSAESLSKKFPGLILAGKSVAERSSVALLTPPAEIEFLRCHGSKGQTLGETVVHRLGAPGTREVLQNEEPPYLECSLATALLDIARWHGVREAVVAMDDARRRNLVNWDEVLRLLGEQEGRLRGTKAARIACFLSHPGAESVRESLVRLELYVNDFPAPLVQPKVLDVTGRFIARPDLLFRDESVAVEYDGQGKYRGLHGVAPADAAQDDMERQHELGTLGINAFRLDKNGFRDPAWVDNLRAVLRRNAKRPFPLAQLRNIEKAWPIRPGPRFRI